jgi:hypothetical protein
MNDNPEARIIAEYERYTGRREVSMTIEPLKPGWRNGIGASPGSKQVKFDYTTKKPDGRGLLMDWCDYAVMGYDPSTNVVWDLYGRPAQVFHGKEDFLKDLALLAKETDM